MKGMGLSLLALCMTTVLSYVFAESVKRARTLQDKIGMFSRMMMPLPLSLGLWGSLFVVTLDYPFPQPFGLALPLTLGSLVCAGLGVLLLFSSAADATRSYRRHLLAAAGFASALWIAQAMLITAMDWRPVVQWNLPFVLLSGAMLFATALGLTWLSMLGAVDGILKTLAPSPRSSRSMVKAVAKGVAALAVGICFLLSAWLVLKSASAGPAAHSLSTPYLQAEWVGSFVGLMVLGLMVVMFGAGVMSDRAEQKARKLAIELSANTAALKSARDIDVITRLPNRGAIEKYLQNLIVESADQQELFSVFYVGLDNFRSVNDSLGFHQGDSVLAIAADRIQHAMGEQDLVARAGGDEFVIVARSWNSPACAARSAAHLLETLARTYLLPQHEVILTASIGVALFPQDGRTPSELLAHANFAMSNVKQGGRNNYCFYSDQMAVAVHHDFQLQAELRAALSQRQMEMFFQPQFNITGEKAVLVGCEALMRWRLPDGSLRMPDTFIPLAERTGLIIPLGNQALELSCEAACRWHQRFGAWYWVGVNVSALQFQQPDFVDNVARVIEKTGILPQTLVLEVTESTAMRNAENTLQKFAQLNALGVQISIDDFGTGYSSLAYLKRFKFDHIKIDRAFVRDLGLDMADQHIVKAVIDLAHNFAVEAVAEGVETADQHALLQTLGCCLAQGYLYGRPMPEADFVRLFLMQAANESAVAVGTK